MQNVFSHDLQVVGWFGKFLAFALPRICRWYRRGEGTRNVFSILSP